MHTFLITIIQGIVLAGYTESTEISWPSGEVEQSGILKLIATNPPDTPEGEYECFKLDDIIDEPVCGTVLVNRMWLNGSGYLVIDVD